MISMFKAVVTDLNGVIRHFAPERILKIENRFQLREGAIGNVAFDKTLFQQVITGQISDEDWRKKVTITLQGQFGHIDCSFAVKAWSEYNGDFDTQVFTYLTQISGSASLCLLTNGTDRLMKDLAALGIDKKFKQVFNSSEIGIAKPDPKIFQVVATALKLKPQEIFLIDNKLAVVEAARASGLVAYQFTGYENLQRDIKIKSRT
jgi:putative hydrolase of the HAD superfamily